MILKTETIIIERTFEVGDVIKDPLDSGTYYWLRVDENRWIRMGEYKFSLAATDATMNVVLNVRPDYYLYNVGDQMSVE